MRIKDIAKKTGFSSSNIIRWLNNSRPIKLNIARKISNDMNFPISIFESCDIQLKYLGKSYLQENDTPKGTNNAI